MSMHRLGMIALFCLIIGGIDVAESLAQPGNFATSQHATRYGKGWWYAAENGGFENITNIPIEELGCKECHGPTDANGNPYPDPFPGASCADCHATETDFSVQEDQCYGCHGRQKTEAFQLGLSDVHRDAGMLCWDCHGTEDMHGDGTQYDSMLSPGAIKTDCEDCHGENGAPLPSYHASVDPHAGALHCTACHTATVISCYNCHFESQVEHHIKRAKQPLNGFVMLANREKDGKVFPMSFQSVSYEGSAFIAFGPYAAHTITREGRTCTECHNTNGSNEAITMYNETGVMQFASWDDNAKSLSWLKGIIPVPSDYEETLKMDFITYDGATSDPAGPSSNWSSIGKDTWDLHQMFFASPLTPSQMEALGFEIPDEESGGWTVRLPFLGTEFGVAFEEFAGVLIVTTTPTEGMASYGLGMQMDSTIFWMDVNGALYFGNVADGTMYGIVIGGPAMGNIWLAEEKE
jgi:hypothetical protein